MEKVWSKVVVCFDRLTSKTYDDSAAEQYTYDKNGNLLRVTPPGNDPVDHVYDALNRLTDKEFVNSSSLDVAYTYDTGGRMLTANTTASNLTYVYNALNRVTSTTQRINSTNYTIAYDSDLAGNRTQVTYPSNKVIDYTYDDKNYITEIEVDNSSLVEYTYDPLGRRTQKDLKGTVTQRASYTYDVANQLTALTNVALPSTTIGNYSYTYDDVGNRLTMTAPEGTHTYSYNDIYELTGAQTHSCPRNQIVTL